MRGNLLVLALHAMACVASFMPAARSPAGRKPSRRLEMGARAWRRLAITSSVRRPLLAVRPGVADRQTLAGVAHFCASRRRAPARRDAARDARADRAVLPFAAWIIASRRGEWDQLLAATLVTVALALPVLLLAASTCPRTCSRRSRALCSSETPKAGSWCAEVVRRLHRRPRSPLHAPPRRGQPPQEQRRRERHCG